MTDEEWQVCVEPLGMLDMSRMKMSPRKFRLLAAACVRVEVYDDPLILGMVKVVERYADGELPWHKVVDVRRRAEDIPVYEHPHVWLFGRNTGITSDAMEGLWTAIVRTRTLRRTPVPTACSFIRCVFPRRQIVLSPEWFTATAVALARGIYADYAFDRMPILADALEDTGCSDADILGHCRSEEPHCRGCWVIDGLLGKK